MNDTTSRKFAPASPEEMILLRAKAMEARSAKSAFRLANKHLLKQEYLDMPLWASLASNSRLRMPSNDDPVSVKGLRKSLKLCNVSNEVFSEHYTSMSYFVANNSRWTAYAAQGLVLELKEGM